MDYIADKMASVGCGAIDIKMAQAICDGLAKDWRDVLDCWYNNGFNIPLLPEFKNIAQDLKEKHDDDTLLVLGAYVSARRNIEQY